MITDNMVGSKAEIPKSPKSAYVSHGAKPKLPRPSPSKPAKPRNMSELFGKGVSGAVSELATCLSNIP